MQRVRRQYLRKKKQLSGTATNRFGGNVHWTVFIEQCVQPKSKTNAHSHGPACGSRERANMPPGNLRPPRPEEPVDWLLRTKSSDGSFAVWAHSVNRCESRHFLKSSKKVVHTRSCLYIITNTIDSARWSVSSFVSNFVSSFVSSVVPSSVTKAVAILSYNLSGFRHFRDLVV